MKKIRRIGFGICPVCGRKTFFVSFHYWLRENYRCFFCRSTPRQRAIVKVLNEEVPNWKSLSVHESSPGNCATHKMFKRQCADYSYSYYFENKNLGERICDCCTNENLENMSFKDNTFDVFITQDVFEHVNEPHKAFAEISRVLREGGVHIFTVPIDTPISKTISRIKIENGKPVPTLPEIYHGNPIDQVNGSLVTYDWGYDISEIVERFSAMQTHIVEYDKYADCEENARYGIEGHSLYVIVSLKV